MASYGQLPKPGRVPRNPQHRFYVEHMPFTIQPFMIAPVIPGETLKNALLQSRVVTDPILNPIMGWWHEYWFFYVKHRDLDGRDSFTDMMLDLNKDMSSFNEAAAVKYNHAAGMINWTKLCLKRITETYFREEGDAWLDYAIDGMPAAALSPESWLQSTALNDVYAFQDPTLVVGADDTVTGSEVDKLMQSWQFMRANNMIDMTYEDWLATYGINTPRQELHRPELLRYIREWSYPSNTINPADGTPSSAVSWAVSDRLDKDRFFSEPGFIVGLTCTRPKVYMKNVDGGAVDLMQNALSWLPALMREDPWTSLLKVAHDKGPLATVVTDTDGYWVDIKDLLLYGDDFINVARSTAGLNMVSVPNAGLTNKYFPTKTDVDGLFKGTTDAVRRVRQDGIVRLSIMGAQVDTTPANSRGD